jgi:GTP cyclohydrolase I
MATHDKDEYTTAIRKVIEGLNIDQFLTNPAQTATYVAQMYRDVFSGVAVDVSKILDPISVPPEENQSQLIMLSSISFCSMCEHHFLPFCGFADVGYVSNGNIVGLGRLTRLVEALSRRPQLQEKLTNEICQQVQLALNPSGVAVHVVARHLCEVMRGTRNESQLLHTFAFTGVMENDPASRMAFLQSISTIDSHRP